MATSVLTTKHTTINTGLAIMLKFSFYALLHNISPRLVHTDIYCRAKTQVKNAILSKYNHITTHHQSRPNMACKSGKITNR